MIQNPIAGETWTTWSQVLDLSGIVSADVETTSVEVKNLTLNTTQKATGSNAWSVAGMALAPGATNILVVKAVGPSRAANLPGATSLSDTLTLLQQQLVLRATIESERRILRWTVGAPPCVIEHCAGLGASNWVQVETNTGSEAWLPWSIEPAFYRVRLLEP